MTKGSENRDIQSKSRATRRKWWVRIVAIQALIVIVVWELAPIHRASVEELYSRTAYPWISYAPTYLADLVPFSLGGVILVFVLMALPIILIRSFLRRRKSRAPIGIWFLEWGERAVTVCLLAYLGFLILWGANYRRLPIEEQLGFGDSPVTRSDVLNLSLWLADRVRKEAEHPRSVDRALESVRRSLHAKLGSWYDGGLPRIPERIKRTTPGLFMTFGTTGMLLPICIEPHVDGVLPDANIVSVAAHEWAHAVGYAGEADAEFVGLIVGLSADDAFARYASTLSALRRSWGSLEDEDRENIRDGLPPVAKADIEAMDRVVSSYRSKTLSNIQTAVQDAFLKSQRVKDGVEDYSRSVKFLVRARRKGEI